MISKNLTIAAAIVILSAAGLVPAGAQTTDQPAATVAPATDTATDTTLAQTDPAVDTTGEGAATTPGMEAAPGAEGTVGETAPDAGIDPLTGLPVAPVDESADIEAETATVENPYGLAALWEQGDFVIKGLLILLVIMSAGSWYIFFMKYWEQSRMLGQARQVEKRFWSSSNLDEGINRLGKSGPFRVLAERGVQAASRRDGMAGGLSQSEWLTMAFSRTIEEENSRMQGGISFLASVGSTAPFVGLLGTVWGIYGALIAIGIAGQASIDKVAGPVGEALIMTAIGLGVAIPAVLTYNFLVRRNKVLLEKMRSFANDLHAYILTTAKGK